MTLFWILAATMVVVVLAVLVRPLLRPAAAAADETARSNLRVLRDSLAELDAELAAGTLSAGQHAEARAELERRALEESTTVDAAPGQRSGRTSALVLAVLLPAAAVLLYAQLGDRRGLDPVLAQPPSMASAGDVETLVQRLAARMQADPSDPQGWMLLGRAYAGLERFDKARDALAEAMKRTPPDAQLLSDYADVLAMTQGQRLAGEPEKLIQQALALEPDHLKALALAGSAAMERGDFKAAIEHWTHARRVAPPDSPFASGLDGSIAEARAAAGLPPESSTASAAPAPAATSAAPLQVTVTLAPALAGRLQPGDTLFVFARAAEGPRMPLAIARLAASAAPVQVKLDDSMAMTPALRLSTQPRVVVGARISRSGDATPQAGDLEGQSAPVASAGSVQVTIDQVRP
jgi:cytochrome c-type biogenesis protein CcmH